MCYLVHFKSKIINGFKRQNTYKIDEIHQILTFIDKNTINIDEIHVSNLKYFHKSSTETPKQSLEEFFSIKMNRRIKKKAQMRS